MYRSVSSTLHTWVESYTAMAAHQVAGTVRVRRTALNFYELRANLPV